MRRRGCRDDRPRRTDSAPEPPKPNGSVQPRRRPSCHFRYYGRRAARLFRGKARLLGAWGAADAEEWIERWRRLTPPAGHWWRKSVFDRARAERTERLRFRRWLTDPAATVRIWAGTRQPPPGQRARWNRYAEADAARYRLLARLDPYQKRAVACFEDRAVVTAGAGSGKTRTMVAHAGYAIKRLGAQPETIAFITFTGKATREIHRRTRRMGLKGLTIGTIHKLARGVLKRVDGVTVQPDRIARDEKARHERVAGWLEEEIEGDPNLAADAALRGAARTTDPGESEASGEEYRIPPHGPTVRSYGEVIIGTLLQAASVEFRYEANFPMPGDMDDKEYHPDFYIPDDPDAPVTADGGIWLEHYDTTGTGTRRPSSRDTTSSGHGNAGSTGDWAHATSRHRSGPCSGPGTATDRAWRTCSPAGSGPQGARSANPAQAALLHALTTPRST